ncbi:10435_t:CDS:2, partial [Scutellospora calospora]
NQLKDLSSRDPWLLNDHHFPSPFDEFMSSKPDFHSNPFQAMDELVDLSIEATEAMLDSLNFNNFDDDDSSVTTIEITIVGTPDLSETKNNEDEFSDFIDKIFDLPDVNDEIDDELKMTLDNDPSFTNSESIQDQDQQYDPYETSFQAVAAFAAVVPVILSMVRGRKEKKYEYFVVHATEECQSADLESAMCIKK